MSEDSRKSDSEHTFDKPEARSSRIKVPIKKSTVIFKKLLMVKGGGGKGSTGGENGHLNRPRYEKRCVRNVFFSFFFCNVSEPRRHSGRGGSRVILLSETVSRQEESERCDLQDSHPLGRARIAIEIRSPSRGMKSEKFPFDTFRAFRRTSVY